MQGGVRILGIDPGSNYLGIACVESRGNNLRCIGHSAIHVSKNVSAEDWPIRLKNIYIAVSDAIDLWKPTVVSVEDVFFAKNAQSALKLGQARGAAIASATMKNLSVFEYSPTMIKQSITSNGRAEKTQVFQMVKMILGASLQECGDIARYDASDALAIAICHAQQNHRRTLFQVGSLEASR